MILKTKRILSIIFMGSVFVFMMSSPALAAAVGGNSPAPDLPTWSIIPFVGMLLSIAVFPLVKPHWWERNLLLVAAFWSLLFLVPFAVSFGFGQMSHHLLEIILLDYVPFIILLWGLFAVSGGIVIKGSFAGSPKVNLLLLIAGTLLASWFGTTGASMLFIRPLLRANRWREKKAHVVVFFIFLVCNIGGGLTPVGDPPLFLGFLRGVPFFWTFNMFPMMLFNIILLLGAFFLIDRRLYKKELANGRSPVCDAENESLPKEKLKIEGLHNLIFIVMIVGAIVLNGVVTKFPFFADAVTGALHGIHIYDGIVLPYNSILQILIIALAGALSIITTKKKLRAENEFNWHPIKEVASLFIGIFITMIPALAILQGHGSEMGLTEPWQFFWSTGLLSSFLDNAPTYLVFLTTSGTLGATAGVSTMVGIIDPMILLAVSAGAVFMGANTYIGNAPNFMVRSIAEKDGVKMPSFFGYMGWSLCFLIPLFILDTVFFFL